MSRRRRSRVTDLTEEEIENIKRLLELGEPVWKISIITHRSETPIRKILNSMKPEEIPEKQKTVGSDVERWLLKNWRWKDPKDQHALIPSKKKRKSNFRTPYCYPGKAHF